MDQQDEIQRDPEVLPPETGEDVTTPVLADEVLPDTLVLLPLPGRPFFPGQVQPVAFNPENWQATLDAIAQQGSDLVIFMPALLRRPAPNPGKPSADLAIQGSQPRFW
mgnify:CR=1 FL=1